MATAVQVESIWNGLTDNSGQPLAAGKVYTYAAGTTTPISLYTSSDKSTSATNPLILDGNGKAQVWADGRYKFVVKSAADVTLYTLDNLLYGFDDTTVLFGGVSTGSANAQVVSVPATVENYSNGQQITFIAGYTNTGAVTLRFNSLSAVSLVKGPSASSLEAGDLISGQMYTCQYYGGSFRLQDYPTVADVQRSRFQIASSVAGVNTITANLVPALTGYETGLTVLLKAASTTTSAATINLNGLGAKAIQYRGGALTGGEIQQDGFYELVYDGTQFQLRNPYYTNEPLWGGTSTGTATAYAITATPGISAYKTGQSFRFISHVTSGASPTLAVGALGAKTIKQRGSALTGSEIRSGDVVTVVYDGTDMLLLDSVTPPLYLDKASGTIGVGTTSPINRLTVAGTGENGSPSDAGSKLASIRVSATGGSANDGGQIEFGFGFGSYTQSYFAAIKGLGASGVGNTTGDLAFYTRSATGSSSLTENMRCGSGGINAIGTTPAANSRLLINGLSTGSGTNALTVRDSASTNLFFVREDGAFNTGLKSASPYNNTSAAAANVGVAVDGFLFRSTSSLKYKTDVEDYSRGLTDLQSLRPVFYKGKNDGDTRFAGLIAEEVHAAGLTEFVMYDANNEPDALHYANMAALFVAAIKQLANKVEDLESRIAALEAQ